jgi:phage replication initiation protein
MRNTKTLFTTTPPAKTPLSAPLRNSGTNGMSKYQTEETMRIDGGIVKIMSASRAASVKAGVLVDYLRGTFKREAVFRSQIPSTPEVIQNGLNPAAGELIIDGIQFDSEIVRDLAIVLSKLLGFTVGEHRQGRDYYDHTFTICNDNGQEVASVSGGGASQNGTFCFSMKGAGCTYASLGWEQRLYKLFVSLEAKLTRIDLCRDFYHGEYGYKDVVQAFQDGEFAYRGRNPSKMAIGDLIDVHSTTFQVGKRESGKVFRGYDKGHQYKLMDDPWWRAEVELRSNNRIIPLEAIINPAEFFAGAYGFCARILEDIEPQSIPTGQKVAEASVERVIRWFERTVAPSLAHISIAVGVEWLTQLVVDQAHRPLPKSLHGLSSASLISGIEKAFPRFTPTPSVPAGLVAT